MKRASLPIQEFRAETNEGHTVNFFFNPENQLIVVDLIHKNELGGHELMRRKIDQKTMLAHCRKPRTRKTGGGLAVTYQKGGLDNGDSQALRVVS